MGKDRTEKFKDIYELDRYVRVIKDVSLCNKELEEILDVLNKAYENNTIEKLKYFKAGTLNCEINDEGIFVQRNKVKPQTCNKLCNKKVERDNLELDLNLPQKEYWRRMKERDELKRLKKVQNWDYYDNEASEEEAFYDMTPDEYHKYMAHVKEKNERFKQEMGW